MTVGAVQEIDAIRRRNGYGFFAVAEYAVDRLHLRAQKILWVEVGELECRYSGYRNRDIHDNGCHIRHGAVRVCHGNRELSPGCGIDRGHIGRKFGRAHKEGCPICVVYLNGGTGDKTLPTYPECKVRGIS